MPSARLIHPVAELYLDGLACYNQAIVQTNDFLRWRYARLATLAFYSSIELAINTTKEINPRSKMPTKWQTKINPEQEPEAWEKFERFKGVRIAITHNDDPDEAFQRMYNDLDTYIDEFRQTTRDMLIRIYGVQALDGWEANIIPFDATE